MKEVEIEDISLLDNQERILADKLFEEYYKKIKRLVKSDLSLKVDVKEHKKQGIKRKLTFNIIAVFAGRVIKSKAWDYDISRAIHKSMIKILNEAEKKFKVSEQNK